jgi:hypothetical protein
VTITPHTRSALLAGACCAIALAAAGCGSDEEGKGIPPEAAQRLEGQLDSIEGRVRNDACQDVTEGDDPNTRVVEDAINRLPSDVDQDVRDALEQSFERLFQLVEDECRPTETETETETTPTETVPPAPTPTETTPTETTPTQTEEEPPNDGQGENGGGGQGGGQGGGGGGGGGGNGGGNGGGSGGTSGPGGGQD